jgi:uncharacterized SAM-binding protein YcdF (DUF218 family)
MRWPGKPGWAAPSTLPDRYAGAVQAVTRIRRWPRRVLLALVVGGLLQLAAICIDGCTDRGPPAGADVAVVLGNHVSAAGEASPRLQRRLDAALALYQDGRVPRIIVSGGQDRGSAPEAEVMKRYLVERGVPADAVIEDRGGINTYATARFVADHMQAGGLRSVVAVSQYYHLTRCKLALRRFGIPLVYGAPAPLALELREPWSWLRELVGWYSYALRSYSR